MLKLNINISILILIYSLKYAYVPLNNIIIKIKNTRTRTKKVYTRVCDIFDNTGIDYIILLLLFTIAQDQYMII